MDDEQTAIHEAGHAVAFYRLFEGRYGGPLTIEPTEETSGSHKAEELTFSLDVEDEDVLDGREREGVYACAGYAALVAAGYPDDVAQLGCESDFEVATETSERDLAVVKLEAVELMSRPENITAVQRIAQELSSRKRLDSDVVDVLIEVADGIATEDEYQRFLSAFENTRGAIT